MPAPPGEASRNAMVVNTEVDYRDEDVLTQTDIGHGAGGSSNGSKARAKEQRERLDLLTQRTQLQIKLERIEKTNQILSRQNTYLSSLLPRHHQQHLTLESDHDDPSSSSKSTSSLKPAPAPTITQLQVEIVDLKRENNALRYTFFGETPSVNAAHLKDSEGPQSVGQRVKQQEEPVPTPVALPTVEQGLKIAGQPPTSLATPKPNPNSRVDLRAVLQRVKDLYAENIELAGLLVGESSSGSGKEDNREEGRWAEVVRESRVMISSLDADLETHSQEIVSLRSRVKERSIHVQVKVQHHGGAGPIAGCLPRDLARGIGTDRHPHGTRLIAEILGLIDAETPVPVDPLVHVDEPLRGPKEPDARSILVRQQFLRLDPMLVVRIGELRMGSRETKIYLETRSSRLPQTQNRVQLLLQGVSVSWVQVPDLHLESCYRLPRAEKIEIHLRVLVLQDTVVRVTGAAIVAIKGREAGEEVGAVVRVPLDGMKSGMVAIGPGKDSHKGDGGRRIDIDLNLEDGRVSTKGWMRLYRKDETDEGGEDDIPGLDVEETEMFGDEDQTRNDILTIMPLYEDDMTITRYYSHSGLKRLHSVRSAHGHRQIRIKQHWMSLPPSSIPV
ncbi:hypothetical protein FFLO_03711 [Filobasidium floriforme]|uniref:Uncharacterized protein n=1 Tax=Filobasidium floriforme TaxID=5210 RepID=A0A8K0JQK4_9TREE|nr:uncharacterized protein HD553DRAFT_353315 [Filobasidium floriforme]KAG7532243.1 hypothetical protein FFLO_03711 [Filobasidium floriforme]KAH8077836.1 hypothetical protein HD553DRAFT_353315 [Filobasidium floriforme]